MVYAHAAVYLVKLTPFAGVPGGAERNFRSRSSNNMIISSINVLLSSKLIDTRLVSIASDYGKAIKSVRTASGIIDDCNPFVTVVPVGITIATFRVIVTSGRHDDNSR